MAEKPYSLLLQDGTLHIEGSARDERISLSEQFEGLMKALSDKIGEPETKKLAEAAQSLDNEQCFRIFTNVAMDNLDPATLGSEETRRYAETARQLITKHAEGEMQALHEFNQKTGGLGRIAELAQKEKEFLVAAVKDPAKNIEGYVESAGNTVRKTLEDEIGTLERVLKQTKIEIPKAAANAVAASAEASAANAGKGAAESVTKEEGFWARQAGRLKHNFGGEAWKERRFLTIGRVLGTGAGAILTVDGVARSKAKDENGKDTDRTGAGRVMETLVGLALATGSALGGRRK